MSTHTQGAPIWVPTRDGRRLYAQVLGSGCTTVIFENGAGATRSCWALVQPAVGQFARAIVYDRAGVGKSPPDADRRMAKMAQDLCDVVEHFATPSDEGGSKVILVGHSAGGPIIRLAAALSIPGLAGLVQLDPTDEGVDTLFAPSFRLVERLGGYLALGLAYTRLMKPIGTRAMKWMTDLLPADVVADLEAESFEPSMVWTQIAASRSFLDEVKAMRLEPPRVPLDLPVTIVSGGKTGWGMGAKVRAEVNAAHERQAKKYTLGRHVVAPNSGHLVPLEDVQLVVDEIRRLV